jgi:hypothetical protein
MLVVMVLLVIVAAAKTMIVSEISLRRGEVSSLRGSLLNAAIDRASSLDPDSASPVRLPVDPTLDQWIEVTMTDDSVRARWYSGQTVIDELARPLKSDPIEPKI